MILVDTSVWIDHLRNGDPLLRRLLERNEVLAHPWITGELAVGNLRHRDETLRLIDHLPPAAVVTPAELLAFIERHKLFGRGIGYVDAQLLASTRLTGDARLWTRDRRLREAGERVGVAYETEPRG